jgi:hypothetical protein
MIIKNKNLIIIIIIILLTVIIAAIITFNIFQPNVINQNTIKIMCIGDSITDDFLVNGSYRKFLYNGLIKKGFNIDMVGTKEGRSKIYTAKTRIGVQKNDMHFMKGSFCPKETYSYI